MGDALSGPVRLSFNPQLRVEFWGATVTSDGGLLLPRELDERLGLSALIKRHLADPRTGHNRQFPLSPVHLQSSGGLRGHQRRQAAPSVALTSTLHWFETEVLTEKQNSQGLGRLNTELVQREAARSSSRRVTLDIDSSPVIGSGPNEVRLLLGVIAYNVGNLLRRLVLPPALQSWSLTSLQQRLLKTGGRLIRHARYFVLQRTCPKKVDHF